MFESLALTFVQRYFEPYIVGLQKDKISVAVREGKIQFHDFYLLQTVANFLNVPFVLDYGKVGTFEINVPWNTLLTGGAASNVSAKISNTTIFLSSKGFENDIHKIIEKLRAEKAAVINHMVAENVKNWLQSTSDVKAKNSKEAYWFSGIAERLQESLVVDLKNITIVIRDSVRELAISFKIGNLVVDNAKEANIGDGYIYQSGDVVKFIEINNFSFTIGQCQFNSNAVLSTEAEQEADKQLQSSQANSKDADATDSSNIYAQYAIQVSAAYEELAYQLNSVNNTSFNPFSFDLPVCINKAKSRFYPLSYLALVGVPEKQTSNVGEFKMTNIKISSYSSILNNISLSANVITNKERVLTSVFLGDNLEDIVINAESLSLVLNFMTEERIRKKFYSKLLSAGAKSLDLSSDVIESQHRHVYVSLFTKMVTNAEISHDEIKLLRLYDDILPKQILVNWQTFCVIKNTVSLQKANSRKFSESNDSDDPINAEWYDQLSEEEREYFRQYINEKLIEQLKHRPYEFRFSLSKLIMRVIESDSDRATATITDKQQPTYQLNNAKASDSAATSQRLETKLYMALERLFVKAISTKVYNSELRNVNDWAFNASLASMIFKFEDHPFLCLSGESNQSLFVNLEKQTVVNPNEEDYIFYSIVANMLPPMIHLDNELINYISTFTVYNASHDFTLEFVELSLSTESITHDFNQILKPTLRLYNVFIIIAAPLVTFYSSNNLLVLDLGNIKAATDSCPDDKQSIINTKVLSFSSGIAYITDAQSLNLVYSELRRFKQDLYELCEAQTTKDNKISTLLTSGLNNDLSSLNVLKSRYISIIQRVDFAFRMTRNKRDMKLEFEIPKIKLAVTPSLVNVFHELLKIVYTSVALFDSADRRLAFEAQCLKYRNDVNEIMTKLEKQRDFNARAVDKIREENITEGEKVNEWINKSLPKLGVSRSDFSVSLTIYQFAIAVFDQQNVCLLNIEALNNSFLVDSKYLMINSAKNAVVLDQSHNQCAYNEPLREFTFVFLCNKLAVLDGVNSVLNLLVMKTPIINVDVSDSSDSLGADNKAMSLRVKYNMNDGQANVLLSTKSILLQYFEKSIDSFKNIFELYKNLIDKIKLTEHLTESQYYRNAVTSFQNATKTTKISERTKSLALSATLDLDSLILRFWENFSSSKDYEIRYAKYYGQKIDDNINDLPTFGLSFFNTSCTVNYSSKSTFLVATVNNMNLLNYNRCTLASDSSKNENHCFKLTYSSKQDSADLARKHCVIAAGNFLYALFVQDAMSIMRYVKGNVLEVLIVQTMSMARKAVANNNISFEITFAALMIYLSEDKSTIPQFNPTHIYTKDYNKILDNIAKASDLASDDSKFFYDDNNIGGCRLKLKYLAAQKAQHNLSLDNVMFESQQVETRHFGCYLTVATDLLCIGYDQDIITIDSKGLEAYLSSSPLSSRILYKPNVKYKIMDRVIIRLNVNTADSSHYVVDGKMSPVMLRLRDYDDLVCILDILTENLTSGGFYPEPMLVSNSNLSDPNEVVENLLDTSIEDIDDVESLNNIPVKKQDSNAIVNIVQPTEHSFNNAKASKANSNDGLIVKPIEIPPPLKVSARLNIDKFVLTFLSVVEIEIERVFLAYDSSLYLPFSIYSCLVSSKNLIVTDLRPNSNVWKHFISSKPGYNLPPHLNDNAIESINGVVPLTRQAEELHAEYNRLPIEGFYNEWLIPLDLSSYTDDAFKISFNSNLANFNIAVQFVDLCITTLLVLGCDILDLLLTALGHSSFKQYPKPMMVVIMNTSDTTAFKIPQDAPFNLKFSTIRSCIVLPCSFSRKNNMFVYRSDFVVQLCSNKIGITLSDLSLLGGSLFVANEKALTTIDSEGGTDKQSNAQEFSINYFYRCVCDSIAIIGSGGIRALFDQLLSPVLQVRRANRIKSLNAQLANYISSSQYAKYFSVSESYFCFSVYSSPCSICLDDIYLFGLATSLLLKDLPSANLNIPAPLVRPPKHSMASHKYVNSLLISPMKYYNVTIQLHDVHAIVLYDERDKSSIISDKTILVPIFHFKLSSPKFYISHSYESSQISLDNTLITVDCHNTHTGNYEPIVEKLLIGTMTIRKHQSILNVLLQQRDVITHRIGDNYINENIISDIVSFEFDKNYHQSSLRLQTVVSCYLSINELLINLNARMVQIILWLVEELKQDRSLDLCERTEHTTVDTHMLNLTSLPIYFCNTKNQTTFVLSPGSGSLRNLNLLDGGLRELERANIRNILGNAHEQELYFCPAPALQVVKQHLCSLSNDKQQPNDSVHALTRFLLESMKHQSTQVASSYLSNDTNILTTPNDRNDTLSIPDNLLDQPISVIEPLIRTVLTLNKPLNNTEFFKIKARETSSANAFLQPDMFATAVHNKSSVSLIGKSHLPSPWTNIISFTSDICLVNITTLYLEVLFINENDTSVKINGDFTNYLCDYRVFDSDKVSEIGNNVSAKISYRPTTCGDRLLMRDMSEAYAQVTEKLIEYSHKLIMPPNTMLSVPFEAYHSDQVRVMFRPWSFSLISLIPVDSMFDIMLLSEQINKSKIDLCKNKQKSSKNRLNYIGKTSDETDTIFETQLAKIDAIYEKALNDGLTNYDHFSTSLKLPITLADAQDNGFCSPAKLASCVLSPAVCTSKSRRCRRPILPTFNESSNVHGSSVLGARSELITSVSQKSNLLFSEGDAYFEINFSSSPVDSTNKVSPQYAFISAPLCGLNVTLLKLCLYMINGPVETICILPPQTWYHIYEFPPISNNIAINNQHSKAAKFYVSYKLPQQYLNNPSKQSYSPFSADCVMLQSSSNNDNNIVARTAASASRIMDRDNANENLTAALDRVGKDSNVQHVSINLFETQTIFEIRQNSRDISWFCSNEVKSMQKLFVISCPIWLSNVTSIPVAFRSDDNSFLSVVVPIDAKSVVAGVKVPLIRYIHDFNDNCKINLDYEVKPSNYGTTSFDSTITEPINMLLADTSNNNAAPLNVVVVPRIMNLHTTAGSPTKVLTLHAKYSLKNSTSYKLTIVTTNPNELHTVEPGSIIQLMRFDSSKSDCFVSIDGHHLTCKLLLQERYAGDSLGQVINNDELVYLLFNIRKTNGIILCNIVESSPQDSNIKIVNNLGEPFTIKVITHDGPMYYLMSSDNIYKKSSSATVMTNTSEFSIIEQHGQSHILVAPSEEVTINLYNPFQLMDVNCRVNFTIVSSQHNYESCPHVVNISDAHTIFKLESRYYSAKLKDYLIESNTTVSDTMFKVQMKKGVISFSLISQRFANLACKTEKFEFIAQLLVKTVGLSVISSSLCQEIIFSEMNMISLELRHTINSIFANLSIQNIQIDNQLGGLLGICVISPVVLANKGNRSFINLIMEMSLSFPELYFKKFHIKLDDCELELSTELILALDHFYRECTFYQSNISAEAITFDSLKYYSNNSRYLKYINDELDPTLTCKTTIIRLDQLIIDTFKITTWCSFVVERLRFLGEGFIFFIKLLTLGGRLELINAPLSFNSTAWPEGVRGNLQTVINYVTTAYSNQLFNSIAILLGYSSLLTIPRIPVELVKTSVGAGVETVNTVTNSMSTLFSSLTFDREYIESRNREQSRTANSLGSGLHAAAKNFGESVVSLTNIFSKPIQGLRREGGAGFVKGILPGVMGSIIKPVDKLGQAVVNVMNGVKAEFLEDVKARKKTVSQRRRSPRVLWGYSGEIRCYEASLAPKLGTLYDNLNEYIEINARTCLLIYPLSIVLMTLNVGGASKVSWKIQIQDIVTVMAASEGLYIKVSSKTYIIKVLQVNKITQLYKAIVRAKSSLQTAYVYQDNLLTEKDKLKAELE